MTLPVVVYRNGAFGDQLLAAQLVAIVRDHGVDALWWQSDPQITALIDGVPRFTELVPAVPWLFNYADEHKWDGRGVMRKALDHFAADFGLPSMQITRRTIPMSYVDDPAITGTDVAICSRSGDWSRYRDYPRMAELKAELDRRGVDWIDLSERNIRNHAALNWARKSKVFLTIETGMAHYAAGVVKSGLVLQSGYSNIDFWASTYPYEALSVPVSCGNCFLTEGCPHGHRCMMDLSPTMIADAIEARIS